jgi:hypothetical protein
LNGVVSEPTPVAPATREENVAGIVEPLSSGLRTVAGTCTAGTSVARRVTGTR